MIFSAQADGNRDISDQLLPIDDSKIFLCVVCKLQHKEFVIIGIYTSPKTCHLLLYNYSLEQMTNETYEVVVL